MKKYIKSIIDKVVAEHIKEVAYAVSKEVAYMIFSQISVEGLKKMLSHIEVDKEKKGYIDYMNLAEIYSLSLRGNLENRQNDIMQRYFELLPKLNEFKEAFNPQIIAEIEKRFERKNINGHNVYEKKSDVSD